MKHIVIPNVIYLPPREVIRHGKDRWIIYLPKEYNDLWEEIKGRGLKVRLYLEVVEPAQARERELLKLNKDPRREKV